MKYKFNTENVPVPAIVLSSFAIAFFAGCSVLSLYIGVVQQSLSDFAAGIFFIAGTLMLLAFSTLAVINSFEITVVEEDGSKD